jgi:hypothetical protein
MVAIVRVVKEGRNSKSNILLFEVCVLILLESRGQVMAAVLFEVTVTDRLTAEVVLNTWVVSDECGLCPGVESFKSGLDCLAQLVVVGPKPGARKVAQRHVDVSADGAIGAGAKATIAGVLFSPVLVGGFGLVLVGDIGSDVSDEVF